VEIIFVGIRLCDRLKYTAWQPAWSAAGGASQRYDGLLITARRAADLDGCVVKRKKVAGRADLTLWGPGVRPDPLSCSAR
jgi:hypothetical protein